MFLCNVSESCTESEDLPIYCVGCWTLVEHVLSISYCGHIPSLVLEAFLRCCGAITPTISHPSVTFHMQQHVVVDSNCEKHCAHPLGLCKYANYLLLWA